MVLGQKIVLKQEEMGEGNIAADIAMIGEEVIIAGNTIVMIMILEDPVQPDEGEMIEVEVVLIHLQEEVLQDETHQEEILLKKTSAKPKDEKKNCSKYQMILVLLILKCFVSLPFCGFL